MKIVICGAGKIGTSIIKSLIQEDHELIVIDNKIKVIENIIDSYDIMGIYGNGTSKEVLQEADIKNTDIFISTTGNDEVNIVSCLIARKLGAKNTIARLTNPEYLKQTAFLQKDLGISLVVYPEYETAREIMRALDFSPAIKVESFARGKVELVEFKIEEGNAFIGRSLKEIITSYDAKVLVTVVKRGDKVVIPDGDYTLQVGDVICLTGTRNEVVELFSKAKIISKRLSNIMVIGGGKIGYYVIDLALKSRRKVKVFEINTDRCKELSRVFPKARLLNTDGTDQEILETENIEYMDSVVSLSNIDEENIVISMYANSKNVEKIILKISRESLSNMVKKTYNATVVTPPQITANQVLSYVRSKANPRSSEVLSLYKLVSGLVEAVEFKIKKDQSFLNKPIKNLRIKKGNLIAAIIREDSVIIPNGSDVILEDDILVIFSMNSGIESIEDLM